MPITCGGRAVAAARVAIGMEEVLDARMALGGRISSASRKIASFTPASSTTASIISSASTIPSTGSTRREHLVRIGPALLGKLLQAAPHRLQAPLDRARGRVVQRDAATRRREHLRDAAAHLPRPHDEHVLEAQESRG